ncbi:DUF7287 family protein [Halovivax gelatinilyticus]|uniref:DUF7287 family protein n=1 Tax=Halovivax gelatinilyticus TaxID=2961597 RepID=UPI0020CA541F|nr:hypothetical protein [Halovivax gelatinilyticus]
MTYEPRQKPMGDDRGQTVQDFAVGIGLFILAVAFIFAFVPTIITPFADAGGAQTAQADRIAATIVDNASTDTPNELDLEEFDEYYDEDGDDLIEVLGLRSSSDRAFDRVNVTIVELDEYGDDSAEYVNASGHLYDGEIGASATRIVTTEQSECDPVCVLTVRVW